MSTASNLHPYWKNFCEHRRSGTRRSTSASNSSKHGSIKESDAKRSTANYREIRRIKQLRHSKIRYEQKNYTNLIISGYNVRLPPNIQLYQTQRTILAKILLSLKNQLNALIESPTGSGKTLGLLSSTCCWLEKYKEDRSESIGSCRLCNPPSAKTPPNETSTISDGTNTSEATAQVTNAGSSFADVPNFTVEEEFDADFASPTLSSWKSRRFSVLEELKRSLSTNENASGTTETKGHSCLPKVTIYYGTRTHKQIGQVVKEFERLPYGHSTIKHTILASREHTCINNSVRNSYDINAKCKELTALDGIGCSFKIAMRPKYESAHRMRSLISDYSEREVWDIEDLVDILNTSSPQLCPYFAATRILTQDADIVFCPFSYIIDPIIRNSSDVRLRNSIVVLDEAHNVEDVCREALSFSFTEKEIIEACFDVFRKYKAVEMKLNKPDRISNTRKGNDSFDDDGVCTMREFLANMHSNYSLINKFLRDVFYWWTEIVKDVSRIVQMKNSMLNHTFPWEELYNLLEGSNLLLFDESAKNNPFSTLTEALSAISGLSNDEWKFDFKVYQPSSSTGIFAEKLLYFLKVYCCGSNRTAYKLNISINKPFASSTSSNSKNFIEPSSISSWAYTSNVLDMNTIRVDEIFSNADNYLKNYDVIKVDCRVTLSLWCMTPSIAFLDSFKDCRSIILASGTLSPFDTFDTELGVTFNQKMEGDQIIAKERIFAAVIPSGPNGNRLCATYMTVTKDDNFFRELSCVIKSVCEVVPKGALCFFTSYTVLDKLYDFMSLSGILMKIQTVKHVVREPRRSSNMTDIMREYEDAIQNPRKYGVNCNGALMLAVFRGKVSEGIDFTDDRARCVISVGIPFPSAVDAQVLEKKKYNDENCKKLNMLSGDDWYTMQAYRALNQALGRCLRHCNDWGAILMVDERLLPTKKNPHAGKVSKWVRTQLRPLLGYQNFIDELTEFVEHMTMLDTKFVSKENEINDVVQS